MILRGSPVRIPRRLGCSLLVLFAACFARANPDPVTEPEIVIESPTGTVLSGSAGVRGSVVVVGNNIPGPEAVPAEALSDVTAVAAGLRHTVALTLGGKVLSWGENFQGQTSVPAAALSGVVAISAGAYHNVALKNDGSVLAWGWNYHGQTDVPASANSGVVAIAGGFGHTLALKDDGSVLAWGDNAQGQTNVPSGLTGVQSVAAGASHSVVLKSDGSVSAWGGNSFGGLTSVPAAALSGVVAIAAGHYHTLALKNGGFVVAWGLNVSGQTNVPPEARSGVVAIAGGLGYSAALKSDGSVTVWGEKFFDPANTSGALTGVAAIAAGDNHLVTLHGPLVMRRGPFVPFAPQTITTASAARTFTIGNTGSAPLEIGSVSIEGANAADFTLATADMLSSVPAGTGKTTFTVTFTPGATGARTAQLLVRSNDANEGTIAISLSGTGIFPKIDVTAFTTGRTAITIGEDGDGNILWPTMTIVTPPLHGRVESANGRIRYIPQTALPLSGDVFIYRAKDDSGRMVTGTVRIENFYGAAGHYDGLIQAGPSPTMAERHRRSGCLRVSLSHSGVFSATLTFGGTTLNPTGRTDASRYLFVGHLDSFGSFSGTIRRAGLPPVALDLHFESETRTFTGAAASRDGIDFTSTITLAERAAAGTLAGYYSMAIFPNGASGSPQDFGFAQVRDRASGNVIVTGTLADRTPFSTGAFLHADKSFPLYTALYAGSARERGSLRGVVALNNTSGFLTPKAIEWFKPARPRVRFFPQGFELAPAIQIRRTQ